MGQSDLRRIIIYLRDPESIGNEIQRKSILQFRVIRAVNSKTGVGRHVAKIITFGYLSDVLRGFGGI